MRNDGCVKIGNGIKVAYFLFNGPLIAGKKNRLTGEEARHLLHARRVQVGEIFEIQDQEHRHFSAVVESVSRSVLDFKVLKELSPPLPSPLQLDLIVAITKEKALFWIIQKATELGATRILIFSSCYSPRTLKASNHENTLRRWKKIAQAACKQCGRRLPPDILFFNSLQEVLSSLTPCTYQWVLSPQPDSLSFPIMNLHRLKQFDASKHRVIVGPEGGLHPEEMVQACHFGMRKLSLGPRTLRSETAVIAIISLLQFLFGDLGTYEN